MKRKKILNNFVEFLHDNYYKDLAVVSTKGGKSVQIDFSLLDKIKPDLADLLLSNPYDALETFEESLEEIDLPNLDDVRIRFSNLPESSKIRIRNIRSEHIGKLICVDGIVKRASEVRPEVAETVFECPECGEKITVIQTEKSKTIQYPTKCDCGCKRGFRVVEQKLYDARWIAVEEPFEITTGEKPSEIMVFLKEDLTAPKMRNKTDPGNRIKITGILKEIPRKTYRGKKSRQLDILLEANNVETSEEEWEELVITPEDEKMIHDFASDSKIYDKLIASLAPTMYGLDKVKLAIVLQLFGGEPHLLKDGTRIRGDIHILLIGDPSVGKSQLLKLSSQLMPRAKYVSGKGVSIDCDDPIICRENGKINTEIIGKFVDKFYPENKSGVFIPPDSNIEIPVLDFNDYKLKWKPITYVYKHKINENLYKILLKTGREVRVTGDHSIFILTNKGIFPKKASELKKDIYLVIPKKIPENECEIEFIDLQKEFKKLPKNIKDNIDIVNSGRNKFLKCKTSNHKIPVKIPVNEKLLRLIGYYIADGSLTMDSSLSYKVKFDCNSNDSEMIKDIEKISMELFNVSAKKYKRKDCNCVNVYIYDKIVYLLFKHILEVKNSSKTKKVPQIVFNVNRELREEFLKAYLHGDYGVTVSQELSSDIQYLFLMNNIVATFSRRKQPDFVQFPDGHTASPDGEFYELKAPKPYRKDFISKGVYERIPIEIFDSEFINSLVSSEYKTITKKSLKRILSPYKLLIINRLKFLEEPVSAKQFMKICKLSNIETARHYLNMLNKKRFAEKIKLKPQKITDTKFLYKISNKGEKLLNEIKLIKKLLKSDLGFAKIKKIERIKPSSKYVYDLSVSGHENFIGGFGGILCHNTGAGLTATVIKDEQFLGGWVLEAGALVLANNSIISIDEFEKMDRSDQVAMHEAMSIQQISIAKASIVATLPARTSVLAGANPKLGRFDPYIPIREQVDITETLLSRFDVKFALRDIPSVEIDGKMIDHVLKSRHFETEKVKSPVDPMFLKKYIAYVRKHCHPELTKEAGQKLKDFYVNLRAKSSGEEAAIPITLRQYEALIRLAEAAAKIQLRDKVTPEDADRAIDIMKFSLRQFGFDPETGMIDIDRAEGGTTSAQRSKIRIVFDIIDELQAILGKNIPVEEIERRAKEEGVERVSDILKKMKNEGMIFEPRYGIIQKV